MKKAKKLARITKSLQAITAAAQLADLRQQAAGYDPVAASEQARLEDRAARVLKSGGGSLDLRLGAASVLEGQADRAEDARYRAYLAQVAKSSTQVGARARAADVLDRLDESAETRALRERREAMARAGVPTWIVR